MPVQVGDWVRVVGRGDGVLRWIDPREPAEGQQRLCKVKLLAGSEFVCMETELVWLQPRFVKGELVSVLLASPGSTVRTPTREPWRVLETVTTNHGFDYMVRMDGALQPLRKPESALVKLPEGTP